MLQRIVFILSFLSLSVVPSIAQDDMMEKIRQLEQQIQELKLLKAQQSINAVKSDHCMKAFAREKFCSCVSTNLPLAVSFEQYVHTVITQLDTLGYEAMSTEQKKVVDDTMAVREKCIEKGFFK